MSIALVALALPAPPVQPLTTCLHDLHARRLRELRKTLEPARVPNADVWSRWHAVQFIKHLLASWFEPERAAVEGAGCHVSASQTAHLWTEAELVAMLGWYVDHAPGLSLYPAEFARITLKLETVLEHWCREVEEAFGMLSWRDLSEEQGEAFAACAGEEPYHVT